MKLYHPDGYRGPKSEAEKKAKELNAAYEVLKDAGKRAAYDRARADTSENSARARAGADHRSSPPTAPPSPPPTSPPSGRANESADPSGASRSYGQLAGIALLLGISLVAIMSAYLATPQPNNSSVSDVPRQQSGYQAAMDESALQPEAPEALPRLSGADFSLEGPTFDCGEDSLRRDQSWTARFVCETPSLWPNERSMVRAYQDAIRQASDGSRLELQASQRNWLDTLAQCQTSSVPTLCLRREYIIREQYLSGLSANSPTIPRVENADEPAFADEPFLRRQVAKTVRDFYGSLEAGRWDVANSLIVPEKRTLPAYTSENLERFFGGLSRPIRLESVSALGPTSAVAQYSYVNGTDECDGRARVTVVRQAEAFYIYEIDAMSGC